MLLRDVKKIVLLLNVSLIEFLIDKGYIKHIDKQQNLDSLSSYKNVAMANQMKKFINMLK